MRRVPPTLSRRLGELIDQLAEQHDDIVRFEHDGVPAGETPAAYYARLGAWAEAMAERDLASGILDQPVDNDTVE